MSGVRCHVSGVTCQMSGVTCQVSRVTCNLFYLFFTKWLRQSVEGLLSTGPTLSSLPENNWLLWLISVRSGNTIMCTWLIEWRRGSNRSHEVLAARPLRLPGHRRPVGHQGYQNDWQEEEHLNESTALFDAWFSLFDFLLSLISWGWLSNC